MKNKKLVTALCATALIGVIGVGATLAYFTDTDSEKNVITMGHVDIDLTEPNFPEDKKVENIVPNQVITKDPTITVKAGSESCYLRAKVDIDGLNKKQIQELLPNISFREGWELSEDGYYYLQFAIGKVGNADQKIVLFDTVTIPETWGNEVADVTFDINVTAEAIQADNFTPARNGEDEINGWYYEQLDENNERIPVTAENYSSQQPSN